MSFTIEAENSVLAELQSFNGSPRLVLKHKLIESRVQAVCVPRQLRSGRR
jgi:hypothetical protein